jgi:hypothetical protein
MSMFSFAESLDGDNPYDLTKYVDRVSLTPERLWGSADYRHQSRFKPIHHSNSSNSCLSSLALGRYWSRIPKEYLGG